MKSTNKITIQRSSLNAEEQLSDGCILYGENSVLGLAFLKYIID